MEIIKIDGKINIGHIKTLNEVKQEKIDELSQQCKISILGRFKSTINGVDYFFSYDTEAQSNFNKAGRAFDKGMITSIGWTAYDVNNNIIRLTLDATTFEIVFADSLMHINTNIYKFRDVLQPQVESATTIDQVNLIVW